MSSPIGGLWRGGFAMSHESLAVQTLMSILLGHDLIAMGEGAELFFESVPPRLVGKLLTESGISAETGLNVIAIRQNGQLYANPIGSTVLRQGAELIMLGSAEQRMSFNAFAIGR